MTCIFDEFIVVAAYVPNSGGLQLQRLDYRVNQWDKDLHAYLKQDLEVAHKKPVVFCGDLNVAHEPIDISADSNIKRMGLAGFNP